jgi:hypothetical protein
MGAPGLEDVGQVGKKSFVLGLRAHGQADIGAVEPA